MEENKQPLGNLSEPLKKGREETVIVLDFLPNGYLNDNRPMHMKTSIAQAIGKNHFILLELVPKKGIHLQPYQEVYIGEGKRDKELITLNSSTAEEPVIVRL